MSSDVCSEAQVYVNLFFIKLVSAAPPQTEHTSVSNIISETLQCYHLQITISNVIFKNIIFMVLNHIIFNQVV